MSSDEKNPLGSKAEAALYVAERGYDDLIGPSAKEVGKALQTVFRTVNAALAPVRGLVWTVEKASEYIEAKVTERLEEKGVEAFQSPDPALYLSAVQGVALAGTDDMRALFANLLATAMDPATAYLAHPGLGELLRQLNPDEARLLQYLYAKSPVIIESRTVSGVTVPGGLSGPHKFIRTELPDGLLQRKSMQSAYIYNLIRLGILQVAYRDGDFFPRFKMNGEPLYPEASDPTRRHEPLLVMTSYGVYFCLACLPVSASETASDPG